jgi:hypothetical protein
MAASCVREKKRNMIRTVHNEHGCPVAATVTRLHAKLVEEDDGGVTF